VNSNLEERELYNPNDLSPHITFIILLRIGNRRGANEIGKWNIVYGI
jgi:hypothetical protein